MIKYLVLSTLILYPLMGMAQSFEVKYDHTALRVADVNRSAEFYMQVFALKEIEPAPSSSTLRWFSLGGDDQLHLIQGETKDIKLHKGVHLAFHITEYDDFLEHLEKENITFTNWQGTEQAPNLRGDGIRQVYIQDPDGYWVEVNDARY